MNEAITIVIPHYRADTLVDCLASVFEHSDLPVCVLVIDDGGNAPSLQRARDRFSEIDILPNESRLGFSGSCNRGLEAVQTRYAVLLNDDTRVTEGWLRPLVELAEANSSIAACQPKLLAADETGAFDYGGGAGGYMDWLGYTFCRGRVFDHIEADEGQYDLPVLLFWACGSAMFLRLDAVREVGYLDLGYFMHFEEIDLCWRLRLAGHHIAAVPASVVYHHSGFSLPPRSFQKTYLNHRNSLVTLCKNMPCLRLLAVLSVRLPLELLAVALYLSRGEVRLAVAPMAALGWCLTHPADILRRRRRSRRGRQPRADDRVDGICSRSIAFQYHLRGRRTCTGLMPEECAL